MSVCCPFTSSVLLTPPNNPLTAAWLARITANGGPAPSNLTNTAINNFLNATDAAGVTSKIYTMCIFVPDSFIAARTPVIKNGGNDPWAATNFGVGDLNINGFTGNGATKFLDPGVVSNATSSYLTLTQSCLFFYAHTANSAVAGTDMGCTDAATIQNFDSNFNSAGLQTFSDLLGQGARLSVATPGNGFYLASRLAANNNQIYFANSTTPWASIASNAIGGSNMIAVGFLCFAFNNNSVVAQWSNSTLSAQGFAKGLTTTEGQALYNALQACRVALGGGFR